MNIDGKLENLEYVSLRSLEEIEKDVKKVTAQIQDVLKEGL